MSRPKWKGPYIYEKKRTSSTLEMPRNKQILPQFVGLSVKVHNGKKYIEFIVSEEMLGHRFGEFSNTRSNFSFKKKKSKR